MVGIQEQGVDLECSADLMKQDMGGINKWGLYCIAREQVQSVGQPKKEGCLYRWAGSGGSLDRSCPVGIN